MGILMDLAVIAILIINVILGYKKGLIKVLFSICAFLIAIIATLILYKPISNIVMEHTDINDKIKEIIIKNHTSDENTDTQENKEKTKLQEYIENTIKDKTNEAKAQAIEAAADVISNKVVEILTGILLFIVIRIALLILNFLTESIAELPIIKQFNQVGGIAYGTLKAFIIIYLLLTILFFIVSIKGETMIADTIDRSYITKFLYENNIIVDYCLLGKNLL